MRGGKRAGAGRPSGAKNKRTEEREQAMEEVAEKIAEVLGPTAFNGDAHALLISLYKDIAQPLLIRLDAAKAAISYEKPRLSSVDANIDGALGTYEAQPVPIEERHPLESPTGPAAHSDPASRN